MKPPVIRKYTSTQEKQQQILTVPSRQPTDGGPSQAAKRHDAQGIPIPQTVVFPDLVEIGRGTDVLARVGKIGNAAHHVALFHHPLDKALPVNHGIRFARHEDDQGKRAGKRDASQARRQGCPW